MCAQIEKLRKELEEFKKSASMHSVDSAIAALQTLIGRPSALFDAYVAIAALEEVVYTAQKVKDARGMRYSVILRQCRPLVNNHVLQSVLIKLVASKEEAEVAKAIGKALKGNNPGKEMPAGRTMAAPYRRRGEGRGRSLRNTRCWLCNQEGHFARLCPKKR